MRRLAMVLALMMICCNRNPAESTTGSTDTVQPVPATTSTGGITATETGTGPPAVSSTTGTSGTVTTTTTRRK